MCELYQSPTTGSILDKNAGLKPGSISESNSELVVKFMPGSPSIQTTTKEVDEPGHTTKMAGRIMAGSTWGYQKDGGINLGISSAAEMLGLADHIHLYYIYIKTYADSENLLFRKSVKYCTRCICCVFVNIISAHVAMAAMGVWLCY